MALRGSYHNFLHIFHTMSTYNNFFSYFIMIIIIVFMTIFHYLLPLVECLFFYFGLLLKLVCKLFACEIRYIAMQHF